MAKPKQQQDTEQLDYLRILGRDYRINYVPPTNFQPMEIGLCDNSTQTISIGLNQTPIEATDTFVHEVFHAIDFLTGLGMTEHQVRHLASTFVGVLQDNPEWAAWVVQDKTLEREQNEKPKRATKRTTLSPSQSTVRADTSQGRGRKSKWSYPQRSKTVLEGQRY